MLFKAERESRKNCGILFHCANVGKYGLSYKLILAPKVWQPENGLVNL